MCLLVTTASPTKTNEPIEVPFGVWTRVGPRNDVLSGGPDPLGEGAILGRTSPACGRYTESYSVGGSSGATYRCQYSSNLLFTAKRNIEALLVL